MTNSHVLLYRAQKIFTISILPLSVVLIIFLSLLLLCTKWLWYHHRSRDQNIAATNTRLVLRDRHQQQPGITVLRRGLDPAVIKTIPVTQFDPKEFKGGLECVICLSEVSEGEETHILPNCNHGFHVECIDMWFYSHSTCPICRNPVSPGTDISVQNLLLETQEEGEGGDFPANRLFWGDETEVITLTSQLHVSTTSEPPASSSSETVTARLDLAIDIQIDCDEDDHKSHVSSRMRSLTRILSGSRRFINPFSPAIEQGTRGHL
ncbi:hypothetical protein SSX86_026720 [Deinandra increscens subsp. villosa]|uniref:RING-type E3 ubiquitin transferase n=1 Tax=Deinandra increscens subsp. villosa TaxID=3103831 RepID=A0AAP0GQD6_9ASTR